jgi:hypothetical protein
MKDIRVDKTMVDGKANFKAININKSASQDDTPLNRDNSAFIYQFHGSAFPRKSSTVVSVSRMSAAAPLIQAAEYNTRLNDAGFYKHSVRRDNGRHSC